MGSSSLGEHSMVGWVIILCHPSVNDHYCLLSSLFIRRTFTKMVFFSCFPWGSLFYRPALNFTHLYAVTEKYSSFTDVQHKKKKKVSFSPANEHIQPKPHWSWPPSFLWKQTFQMYLGALAFFCTDSIGLLFPHIYVILRNWGEVGLCGKFHEKWSLGYCKS